jgi:hypothetical protein
VSDLPLHVIREHRFERELRALIRGAREADAFVEAAEFVLARDPLAGQETEHQPVWALPMPLIGGSQIVLYYTFNESTVWLLSIVKV